MFCTKCGSEIPGDARFCGICGQPVTKAATGESSQTGSTGGTYNGSFETPFRPANDQRTILKIFAAVMAVIFLIYTLRSAGGFFSNIRLTLMYFTGMRFLPLRLISMVLTLISTAVFAVTTWCFALILLKWEEAYSDSLFGTAAAACLLDVALAFLTTAVNSVNRFLWGFGFGFFIDRRFVILLVISLIAVIGLYFVLAAAGCKPNLIMEKGSLGDWMAFCVADAIMLTKEGGRRSTKTDSFTAGNGSAYGNAGSGNPLSGQMLKTDRSLVLYIVLSIITCGIYSLYFMYQTANDVNVACAGDGETTTGLLKLICFSILTCGIYTWYWYYKLGNRLANNAPRYGKNFQENGTTVLLWMLLGTLICGVGTFIGMHILIKNTNEICKSYNDVVLGQTSGSNE